MAVPRISSEELKRRMDDAAAAPLIIDVRLKYPFEHSTVLLPGAVRSGPGTIDRPGVYVVQAGSFRKQEDADRVQQQLRKLGIDSSVQRVQMDQGEVFRVRIGPLTDLAEINRLRARLSAADFESQAFRVAD